MKFFSVATALVLAALRVSAQNPDVRSFTWSGDGCPTELTTVDVAVTTEFIRYTPPSFGARVGPDVDVSERRNTCRVSVQLGIPLGFRFKLASTVSSSTAVFEAANASQALTTNTYFFSSNPLASSTSSSALLGPAGEQLDEPYVAEISIFNKYDQSELWSSCGGEETVNIATTFSIVNAGPAHMFLGIDDSDTLNRDIISPLVWEAC